MEASYNLYLAFAKDGRRTASKQNFHGLIFYSMLQKIPIIVIKLSRRIFLMDENLLELQKKKIQTVLQEET